MKNPPLNLPSKYKPLGAFTWKLPFFHRLPTANWHEIPSVNTVLVKLWHREFLILQELIYGELRKSPMSKFRFFMIDHSRGIFLMTGFLNHFLSLVFNQPCCHGNSTRLNQNARINSRVVNLDSCKKTGAKS